MFDGFPDETVIELTVVDKTAREGFVRLNVCVFVAHDDNDKRG